MTDIVTAPGRGRAGHGSVADLLLGWDHLEWWVGNARAVSGWLMGGFGFRCTAYRGPETGVPDRVSYLLEQGEVRFVVTAALGPDSEIADHVRRHGDGVRHVAFRVADVQGIADLVGTDVRTHEDEGGSITVTLLPTYGDTDHLFVDRSAYRGAWGPGFRTDRLPLRPLGPAVGLTAIDHVVGNVEEGRLDDWVGFYERLGFAQMRHFDAEAISTQYSALRSTVVWNGGSIVMPINEPAPGLRRSQISEYLDANRGPGVQHIALRTPAITDAVAALRDRGVRFLDMPAAYYEDARARCGALPVPWAALERLGIEIDTDRDGYLLQIFTETVTDRPTLFIEIIQREGATGFGEGNFKALFEAIEREQARRGNL
ncbi:MAG: 4-hydroxyphenylpyruvate dioxygenase [Acidimicrobiales bacterium]